MWAMNGRTLDKLFIGILAAAVLKMGCAAAETARKPPLSVSEFRNILGVNIHSTYGRSSPYNYANVPLVLTALRYIGVDKVRDGISMGHVDRKWAYTAAPQKSLAENGVKFNFALGSIDTSKEAIDEFVRAYPKAVTSIEGYNEINRMGKEEAIAGQKHLYEVIRSDPLLAKIPVVNFSLAYASNAVYRPYGDLSSIADLGNAHIYANAYPPSHTWSGMLEASRLATPTRPMVVTETGFVTLPEDPAGVDDETQAKDILNMLFDAAKSGVQTVYVYELLDRVVPHPHRPKEGHFGLFKADGSPKPAADALHRLGKILSPSRRDVKRRPLEYALTGGIGSVSSLLMQKTEAEYDLVLWSEPSYWNAQTREPLSVAGKKVVVETLANANFLAFDPLRSAEPIARGAEGKRIAIEIVDHPIIVQIQTDAHK